MLEYHSLWVMNLAAFVMYLLLVMFFCYASRGCFPQTRKKKIKQRPLLGCLPEYRTIYPPCDQFSVHAFCWRPKHISQKCSSERSCGRTPSLWGWSLKKWGEGGLWNISVPVDPKEGTGQGGLNNFCRIVRHRFWRLWLWDGRFPRNFSWAFQNFQNVVVFCSSIRATPFSSP